MNNKFIKFFINLFKYNPKEQYNFSLSSENVENNSNEVKTLENLKADVFPIIDANLEFIKNKFNFDVNSDIKIREFDLNFRDKKYRSFIIYIDGMCNTQNINRFVLHPLMLRINNRFA